MATSQRVRERDRREAGELVGQCRELGCDSNLWRLHLMVGLERLVGATVSCGMEVAVTGREQLRVLGAVSRGWAREEYHQLWLHFIRHENPLADVVLQQVYRQHQRRPRLLTRTREQLLDDRTWRRSVHYNDYRKASELDSCIYSWCPLHNGDGVPEAVDLIAIHRAPNDKPFDQRERRLVGELHRQLGALVGKHLASPRGPSVAALSPRLRQTLQCLLQGLREKETAEQLDVSPATLHQYVSALYRHFGVSGRNQLLARWIRYGPRIVLPADLSARQRQTLQLLLEGMSDEEIADQLGLSIHTVHQHVRKLLSRFDACSRAQLMARWIRFKVDKSYQVKSHILK